MKKLFNKLIGTRPKKGSTLTGIIRRIMDMESDLNAISHERGELASELNATRHVFCTACKELSCDDVRTAMKYIKVSPSPDRYDGSLAEVILDLSKCVINRDHLMHVIFIKDGTCTIKPTRLITGEDAPNIVGFVQFDNLENASENEIENCLCYIKNIREVLWSKNY